MKMSVGNKVHPVALLYSVKCGYSQECSEDSILMLLMGWQSYFIFKYFFFSVYLLLIGSGGFRKRKHDNFPHGQRREEKENVNPSSALMMSFKCK